jgi:hypothetical protein
MAFDVDSFQVSGHFIHADDLVEGISYVKTCHLNFKLLSNNVWHILKVLQLKHAHLIAELNCLNNVSNYRAHLYLHQENVCIHCDSCKRLHNLVSDNCVCELDVTVLLCNLLQLVEMSVLSYSYQVAVFFVELKLLFADFKYALVFLVNFDFKVSRRLLFT